MKRQLILTLIGICQCFLVISCQSQPETFDAWYNKINDYLNETYVKSVELEDRISSVTILSGIATDWSKELPLKRKQFISEQKGILNDTLKIVKKTKPPKDFKVFHERILINLEYRKQSLEAMENRNPLYMLHLAASGNDHLKMALYELENIFVQHGAAEKKTSELNTKIETLKKHNELLGNIWVAAMSK
ncbi:MAG: hypothetical protein KAI43_01955 [Candidatus Aureabacteria bacterium]|nr:hypothetical protein [Candidatus Auribacterota bacterium]